MCCGGNRNHGKAFSIFPTTHKDTILVSLCYCSTRVIISIMFVTIINDCRDDNARARQESRITSLTGLPTSFIGVQSDLEAGMQLIDILDATEGKSGLVLVNVAPRGGHTIKWENGTPFAYFTYQDTLIVSSIDGYTLSGIKKFTDVAEIVILDTAKTSDEMAAHKLIDQDVAEYIPQSQFRSLDFIPRVGAFLLQGNTLSGTTYQLQDVPDLPSAVWHIDNFGNCKTTLTEADISNDDYIVTQYETLPYIKKLRDLPDNTNGIIKGSSGVKHSRLLELMSQRGNFAKKFCVNIGDDIFINKNYFVTATG